MLLRGCLMSLGLLVVLVAGYAYWFSLHFERTPSLVFGGVVGCIVFFCLGLIGNARTAWRDWRLLSAAARDTQLIDGTLVAVCGTIQPLERPLAAPFSGKQCVICEYDLSRSAGGENAGTGGSDYVGFLMTPSEIRSPLGAVRLLGFPVLEGVEQRRCRGYAAAWNARQFLASHDFEDRTGLKLVTAVSAFDVVWSDDDGYVEKNMQLGRITLEELFPPESAAGLERLAAWEKTQDDESRADLDAPEEGDEGGIENGNDEDDEASDEDQSPRLPDIPLPKLLEKRIALGEQVCVIGIYSAEREGLVPSGPKGPANRLLCGSASQLAARARSKIKRQLLGGIVGLALLHALILVVMATRG